MRSLLRNAVCWVSGSSGVAHESRQRAVRRKLSLESLEDRRVLSAAPALTPFVTALYQDVLNRAPDQDGLTHFNILLTSGTRPSEIVAEIWQSAEHRAIEVEGFYQTILGRAADPVGSQFWVGQMAAGMSEESIVVSFLNSSEFQQLNPSPTQFVTALYRDMLGRDPDSAGLSMFVTELTNNSATAADVVRFFANSTERHLKLVDSIYSDFLNRPSDPTGAAFWTQQLDRELVHFQVLAETFLSSGEFITQHQII
jgi:hypothetical protein